MSLLLIFYFRRKDVSLKAGTELFYAASQSERRRDKFFLNFCEKKMTKKEKEKEKRIRYMELAKGELGGGGRESKIMLQKKLRRTYSYREGRAGPEEGKE